MVDCKHFVRNQQYRKTKVLRLTGKKTEDNNNNKMLNSIQILSRDHRPG